MVNMEIVDKNQAPESLVKIEMSWINFVANFSPKFNYLANKYKYITLLRLCILIFFFFNKICFILLERDLNVNCVYFIVTYYHSSIHVNNLSYVLFVKAIKVTSVLSYVFYIITLDTYVFAPVELFR